MPSCGAIGALFHWAALTAKCRARSRVRVLDWGEAPHLMPAVTVTRGPYRTPGVLPAQALLRPAKFRLGFAPR